MVSLSAELKSVLSFDKRQNVVDLWIADKKTYIQ